MIVTKIDAYLIKDQVFKKCIREEVYTLSRPNLWLAINTPALSSSDLQEEGNDGTGSHGTANLEVGGSTSELAGRSRDGTSSGWRSSARGLGSAHDGGGVDTSAYGGGGHNWCGGVGSRSGGGVGGRAGGKVRLDPGENVSVILEKHQARQDVLSHSDGDNGGARGLDRGRTVLSSSDGGEGSDGSEELHVD